MRRQMMVGCLLFLVTLAACDVNNVENPTPAPGSITFRAEANREAAFVIRDGERETLPLIQQATATASDGLAVDEGGRATLSLNNVLTLELLRAGQIEIKSAIETDGADGAVEIVLQQAGGLLFSEFNPERRDNHTLVIQTTSATMTTTGTRLIVTRSADNIEWFVNLGPADSQMTITAADETQAIPGGTARWVSPDGLLSASVPIDGSAVETWFDAAQNGAPPSELAEVLLPPADILGNVASLTALPRPGEPFELGTNSGQGVVQLTLDPTGLFGAPTYRFEDCTGDGNQELALLAGVIHFEFGSLAAQVKALDVTLVNRDLPGNGAVWTTGLDGQEVARQLVEVGGDNRQTLSLRSTQAYQSAQLALIDGCLIGFSLTPPSASGAPAPPRVITVPGQTEQSSTVVNILAEDEADDVAETSGAPSPIAPAGQQRTGGSIEAWPLAAENAITIDGDLSDWGLHARQNQTDWSRFSRVVYNQACDSRFPSGTGDDLSGQVLFAYDAQSLYVAYQVVDDGFVGYSGADQQYFLGDAPQLSLDMELLSDYTDPERSRDDWQIDFFPDPASPLAVLWQLGTLSSRQFEEASVAARQTDEGYILEAAIPWISLGIIPQPGDRIGLAANINDNDTPDSDAQECIISTAPQWVWNDPTTWGTLLLQPERN